MVPRKDDLQARFEALCKRIQARSDKLARMLDVLAAKNIYEEMFPESRRGGAPGAPGGGKTKTATVAGFAVAIAEKTRRSARAVFLDAQIADGLTIESRERLRGTPIAMQTTILRDLSMLPDDRQAEVTNIYLKRAKAKGDVAAEATFKRLVRPPTKAAPRPQVVTEFDEVMPLGGTPLEASLLGSVVAFTIEGGRLHAKVLRADAESIEYRWPTKPNDVPTTTANWSTAIRHAVTLMPDEARALMRVGQVEAPPPKFCESCGEGVFYISQVDVRERYQAPDGPRLSPTHHWPHVVSVEQCRRCHPRSGHHLSRDLSALRHQLVIEVEDGDRAPLRVTTTLWNDAAEAGLSFRRGDGHVITFEVGDEKWKTWWFKGAGDPYFASLGSVLDDARSVLRDVYRLVTTASVRLA